MKHRLLYNQRSRPLVVRRENAALTHEASTSIQLLLHAEVVGAARHVGQRADEVVAALKRRIQQHRTHVLHFLQPGNTQRRVSHERFSVHSGSLCSDSSPAGRELPLRRRAKRSQSAPWDIGLRGARPPPSCSQTSPHRQSAHLRETAR